MRHITPYVVQEYISKSPAIENIEKYIPENLRMQVEIDLIVNQGARSIHRCYENIANGTLQIPSIPRPDFNKLKASCLKLIKELNEQTIEVPTEIEGDNVNNVMDGVKDSQIEAAKEVAGEDSLSLLGILGSMFDALSENGSPIGILHLVLDVIGIAGDFFGPWGIAVAAIADIINGIIYFIRAEMDGKGKAGHFRLLGILSLISAVPITDFIITPFKALIKSNKAGAKLASEFFNVGAKGGSMMTDKAVKLTAAASPATITTLSHIALNSKKLAGLIGDMLDTFFSKFLGKIASIIPGIGAPLQKFFKYIGSFFSSFKRKAATFADEMPRLVKLADAKKLKDFFSGSLKNGNKIFTKGNDLILKDAKGAVISRVSGGLMKASQTLERRFGPSISRASKDLIGDTEKAGVIFYKNMGSILNKSSKWQGKAVRVGGKIFRFKTKLALLLGRQVIKIFDELDKKQSNFNKDELTAIGLTSMDDKMNELRKEAMSKNPNQVYAVPLTDSLSDSTVIEVLNRGLNDRAEEFGLPKIFNLAHHRLRRSSTDRDVLEYLDSVGITKPKENKKIKSTSESTKLKFIKRPNS
tara:strand:- start:4790 stop:6541 length:1752 start_codon:yes stop_codon:yes gene_type:complete